MNDKRLSPLIIISTRNKLEIEDYALSFIYYELSNFKDGKKSAAFLFSKIPLPRELKLNINDYDNFILKRIISDVITKNDLYNPLNIINYAKTKKSFIYNSCISNTTSIQDLSNSSLSQSHNVTFYENSNKLDKKKILGRITVPIKELEEENNYEKNSDNQFVPTNFTAIKGKN